MTKKKTIEATILEIEQIAQIIEEDDISIDDVIKTYKEGIVLINGVKKEIANIINEIEQIDTK
jgi:exodeoxyribonuclease VII small subunit